MILAQIIPDPDKLMDASNSLIVDQGIAIFAVVVFAIVIFGMMAVILMGQRQAGAMLKQMGRESNQQDKLITQNDLNRVAAQRNTDELVDVKQLLAKLIDMQTNSDNDKQTVIKDGIKSIEDNTESVGNMNGKLVELEKTIDELVKKMADTFPSVIAKVEAVEKGMKLVLKRLDELKSEAETPTEETPVTQTRTGVPPPPKVTVEKRQTPTTKTGSVTYPGETEKESTS